MQLYDWLAQIAAQAGSGKALVYRDTYLSWRGLTHRVDRRAQELDAMGVGAGSWVGLMLGNVPDFVILALALSKLGAVIVPLDPTTGHRELEMVLEAAPLRALVTRPRGAEGGQQNAWPSFYNSARQNAAARPPTPVSKFTPESRRRLQGTLLACSLYKRVPPAALADKDLVAVHFTADVGGDPKGVLRSASTVRAVADSLSKTLNLKAADRILCTAALHNAYGFDFGLLAALAGGATLFLEDEISPKRIAKLLREQSIDFFPGNPALYGALVRVPTIKPLQMPEARYISSGSALSRATADAFHQRFGLRLLSCYHATEGGPLCIDRAGKDPVTVGKPFEGVEVRVAAADGTKLPSGQSGPVWVRSGALSVGSVPLVRIPARDGVVPVGGRDADGWCRTGDIGTLDRSGRLTLSGREDDLVNVDGKRVALGEVEGCLESFPKVKAAEVRVVMDELGGPIVVARVVRTGACKAEEIIDFCARNLAPHKVPRQIEFCEQLA